MAQTITLEKNQEELIKLLEAHIQSGNLNFLIGSGASHPAISLAGSIEQDINSLLKDGKNAEADQKAWSFLSTLDSVNNRIIEGNDDQAITDTLKGYTDFLSTLDTLLFARKNLLLPRQANLFTTNYDFFFERAASDLTTVNMNDGFDRTSAAKAGFPFAPERYSDRIFRSGKVYERHTEVPSFNLIKLHGSLTWRKGSDESIFFGKDALPVLSEEDSKDPSKIRDHLMSRAVILPNVRKFESTVLERVYFDLLRIYSNALDKENALLLVFGFSFADEHILDITRRALRNPTAKMIVFSYSAKSITLYAEKFKHQRNALVVGPQEGESIKFEQFNAYLKEVASSGFSQL